MKNTTSHNHMNLKVILIVILKTKVMKEDTSVPVVHTLSDITLDIIRNIMI